MKCLITAATVRQEKLAGKKRIEVALPQCIVTPEARLVAEQLGLELVETIAAQTNRPDAGAPGATGQPTTSDLAAIRAAVLAKLPSGSVPADVVDQLVKKVAGQQAAGQASSAPPESGFQSQTTGKGIKHVSGDTIKMGIFDGAGRENRVGVIDVVTADDGSSMAAGFMAWENCFFPWTLTYDEIDFVQEGELHIRCAGETVVGKAGDVIFIPKNTSIEFGTPTRVKFLFIAYPANWQEC
ncbi:MAG: ethanolamine utilization acetate kinase EutQ [Desulfovibrio sp.]|jgi:ethanolamine utilization protein EutQ|nr:ethanolamine utilization acetate kinase EutQ [Desulfovibrio sp.]